MRQEMRWGEKIWWNNQSIFKWIPRKRTAKLRQKLYSSLSICKLKTLVLWHKNPNLINKGGCKVTAYETLERQTKKISLRPSPPKPDLRVWRCHPKGNNGCQKTGEPLMTNPQILTRGNQCGLVLVLAHASIHSGLDGSPPAGTLAPGLWGLRREGRRILKDGFEDYVTKYLTLLSLTSHWPEPRYMVHT